MNSIKPDLAFCYTCICSTNLGLGKERFSANTGRREKVALGSQAVGASGIAVDSYLVAVCF